MGKIIQGFKYRHSHKCFSESVLRGISYILLIISRGQCMVISLPFVLLNQELASNRILVFQAKMKDLCLVHG